MQGTYKISTNGNIIEQGNIITNSGRLGVLNAVAGRRTGFVESISVGIGNQTATVDDTQLQFEVSGATISAAIVDPVNEKIYFKAVLPIGDEYEVYELGCYANSITTAQNISSKLSALLVNFNSQTRWTDSAGTSVIGSSNNRLDANSIQATVSGSYKGYASTDLDLSSLPDDTKFSLASYTMGATAYSISFDTDSSNYYSYTLSNTNGYKIESFLKSDLVATGSPNWNDINSITISINATSGFLSLDGLRYDSSNGVENNILTRAVLSSPVQKLAGITMDVEYVLDLNV